MEGKRMVALLAPKAGRHRQPMAAAEASPKAAAPSQQRPRDRRKPAAPDRPPAAPPKPTA